MWCGVAVPGGCSRTSSRPGKRLSLFSIVALGLTPAGLSALSVLVFGGPAPLRQLAEAEQVAAPTMSRIVAAAERKATGSTRTAPGRWAGGSPDGSCHRQ